MYTPELVQEALRSLGFGAAADRLDELAARSRPGAGGSSRHGYHPDKIRIPKRFLEVETWKGRMDRNSWGRAHRYAKAILSMAARLD